VGARTRRLRSAASYGPEVGTTYLLHFDRPYRHARHYIGWTQDLAARLDAHLRGRGARLIEVITQAGIGFKLARTWPETTRDREDSLKHRGDARRFCPACGVQPRQQPAVTMPARRLSLYELERSGTWADGTPLPEVTGYPPATARWAAHRKEPEMFGSKARAQRQQQAADPRQQAEADRLFALADELEAQAGARPSYQREITAERAARIRAQLGALTQDARQQAREPRLEGADLDAEIDRLAEAFPEAERQGPEPGPDAARCSAGAEHAVDTHPRVAAMTGQEEDRLTAQEYLDRPAAAPGYHRSAPGSAGHRAAYAAMHARDGNPACADPGAGMSYEIDNAAELAAERYYGEMAERYYGEPAGGPEAGDGALGAELGLDAARRSPEAADAGRQAPDHLYGSPECAEVGPETAHFGLQPGEPQDAGQRAAQPQPEPLPRLLAPAQVNPELAPLAAALPDGTPHSDPALAARGWQAQGGVYVRPPQAQLEAG
jgi:predicted GIY-YIG superfamily endonuclease